MSKENENVIELKVILVGNSGVGKTNLINVCVGQSFDPESKPTNCISLLQKSLLINGYQFEVNLWDTMGQEVYKGISKLFFREAQIVIFVYDITSKESFDSLEEWIDLANDTITNPYISGIVGNKNDLYLNAKIEEEEARKYAENREMKFKLVSAKDNPKSFNNFLVELIKMYKVPENIKKVVLKNEPISKTKKCC